MSYQESQDARNATTHGHNEGVQSGVKSHCRPVPTWVPVFHIYQPPQQRADILHKICEESYFPLLELADDNPDFRFTLNASGSLLEQMDMAGQQEWLKQLAQQVSSGQIELMATAAYHPIMPLIAEDEKHRQIDLNYGLQEKHLGRFVEELPKLTSFFLPELAYDFETSEFLSKHGIRRLVLSEASKPAKATPQESVVETKDGMLLFFRDDLVSNTISFNNIGPSFMTRSILRLKREGTFPYVITAQDGETYGHHRPGLLDGFLRPLAERIQQTADRLQLEIRDDDSNSQRAQRIMNPNTLRSMTLSDLAAAVTPKKYEEGRAASWSTPSSDRDAGIAYSLWFHPENSLHIWEWNAFQAASDLVNIAKKTNESAPMFKAARQYLDWACHSCTWWWSSGLPWYSPEMIIRGVGQMVTAGISAYKACAVEFSSGNISAGELRKCEELRAVLTGAAEEIYRLI